MQTKRDYTFLTIIHCNNYGYHIWCNNHYTRSLLLYDKYTGHFSDFQKSIVSDFISGNLEHHYANECQFTLCRSKDQHECYSYDTFEDLNNRNLEIPQGSSLFNRPVKLNSWSTGRRIWNTSCWITVMKNGGRSEHLRGEACWDNNEVILCCLISCNQNRIGLPQMDIKGIISVLQWVSSFDLHQQHFMPLNSEIDRSGEPHIWYP